MTKHTKEEVVTIPMSEYQALLERSQWLSALECAGVDNWQGIEEAHNLMEEWEAENDE